MMDNLTASEVADLEELTDEKPELAKIVDPEIKSMWLAALRSGEHQQGTGQLRIDDCYCCLGVLAKVLEPEKFESECWASNGHLPTSVEYRAFGEHTFEIELTQETLVTKNDLNKWTFDQIADFIEENL